MEAPREPNSRFGHAWFWPVLLAPPLLALALLVLDPLNSEHGDTILCCLILFAGACALVCGTYAGMRIRRANSPVIKVVLSFLLIGAICILYGGLFFAGCVATMASL